MVTLDWREKSAAVSDGFGSSVDVTEGVGAAGVFAAVTVVAALGVW